MTDPTETTSPARSAFAKKIRTLAVGTLAAATLSIPAVTALSVSIHDAGKAPAPSHGGFGGVSPDSHRLALNIQPNSLRLT